MSFSTPVAFLIFNRPELTKIVFEGIRQAKPKKLLVVADGARFPEEVERCEKARAIVEKVDWDCEVFKNYSDVNLGCKLRVSSGLNWVFNIVEEAIILEDDCVPHPDFFRFCEKMLEYYNSDTRIMMICGTNYLHNKVNIEESYFFSNYYPVWGWATWKRAWRLYDVDIQNWETFKSNNQLKWIFSNKRIAQYYENMFQLIKDNFNTWDIQWWYTCIFQNSLAIVPRVNLISNIGFVGTHAETQRNICINMPTYAIDTNNFKHPKFVTPNILLNQMTYELSHACIDMSSQSIDINFFKLTLLKRIRDRVKKRLQT
ncbi:hemolytic protein HlpA-like protein [Chlorogloea sp. CCALA 695]|uniref:hemolytic protein HlpA-like protein n=1 Tax=Chlorogloea sp. CCALA 695 TaxID=2107693 RepID=UPI000D06FDC7|nr:hemolytic protein HlpA-like protein [Chlorogloea sp. CCALA 695]PSB32749.1 hemolytic protein HlpA-like protein [Chlorogloea sp. CCALA 695]